jgi:hypothetical protein
MGSHIVQNNQRLSPSTVMITNSIKNTVVVKRREQLLDEKNQQDSADGGKQEVMNHEEGVELQSREFLHNFTTAEDDDIVGDQGSDGFFEGRHWGLVSHEAEVICRIADRDLEGLVEVRP